MRRSLLTAAVVCGLLTTGPAAFAESGSLTDPKGDFPDIRTLSYANKTGKAVVTMKYADMRPQNESFYLRFGDGKYYQVFVSSGIGMKVLRFKSNEVPCDDLQVSHDPAVLATKVVVPRSCLPKASNRLKFQGIATEGLMSSDETKVSPYMARG